MKYFALALVALFGLFACIQATVVELTDENFGDLINKEDEWLIDFYADWCGFCKRLEPKFQAADRLLDRTEYRHVKLGKINVETNPGLAARFFVSRLPTIVHVKDHEVRVMKPTQKESEIIAFITLEEWREVEPKSGVISPFSLFGKMVGFVGKVVKQLSSHSPWTLIGVLTGFLVFAISLPILFGKPREEDTKKHDTEGEKSSETKKDVIKPQLRERKSKRID